MIISKEKMLKKIEAYENAKVKNLSDADAKIRDAEGNSILHYAVKLGKENLVNLWAKKIPDVKNNKGQNLLHIACANGNENIAKILLKQSLPDSARFLFEQDEMGDTPLHLACRSGNQALADSLLIYSDVVGNDTPNNKYDLNIKNANGKTPWEETPSKGKIDWSKELARKKDELNVINVRGDGNCFFRAVSVSLTGSEENHDVLRQIAVDYIINNQDDFKDSMVGRESVEQYANKYKNSDTTKGPVEWADDIIITALSKALLIKYQIYDAKTGKKVNNFNVEGAKNVVYLSYHKNNHYDALINPNIQNIDSLKTRYSKLQHLLITNGENNAHNEISSSVSSQSQSRRNNPRIFSREEMLEKIKSYENAKFKNLSDDDAKIRDEEGNSILHYAVGLGKEDLVNLWAKKIPDAKNSKGQNLLHIACANGNENIAKILLKQNLPDSTKLLFEEDKRGNTPLNLAYKSSGNQALVDNLLIHASVIENQIQSNNYSTNARNTTLTGNPLASNKQKGGLSRKLGAAGRTNNSYNR